MPEASSQFLVPALIVACAGLLTYLLVTGRRHSVVFHRIEPLLSTVDELMLQIVELQLDRTGHRYWNALLRAQIYELGAEPVPPPSWLAASSFDKSSKGQATSPLISLYHQIGGEHFGMEDITNLAFDAGIDPESFGGDTKQARARELVMFAAWNGKLSDIIRVARSMRPWLEWPQIGSVKEYDVGPAESKSV